MPKQQPRLMLSPLTNRVYIVTRYNDFGDGLIGAIEKFDATEDFLAVWRDYPKENR